MKVCVRLDRSAGNETVGEMWSETLIVDSETTIEKIFEWADKVRGGRDPFSKIRDTRYNLRLSLAQELSNASK